jgi:hypothetical protein
MISTDPADSLVRNWASSKTDINRRKGGTAMTVRFAESASGSSHLGSVGAVGPAGCPPAHTAAPRPEVLVGSADRDSPFVPRKMDDGEHSRRPSQGRTHRKIEPARRPATVTAHAPTTTYPLRTRRREPPPPRDGVQPLLQGPTTAGGDADHGGAGSHSPGRHRYSGKITLDADVAWQLADAASLCLTGYERTIIFVELGCGEYHLAAERILAVVVGEGFPLPAALLTTLTTWLDRHVGMEWECRLNALLDRVTPGLCEAAVPGTLERSEGGAIATPRCSICHCHRGPCPAAAIQAWNCGLCQRLTTTQCRCSDLSCRSSTPTEGVPGAAKT